MSLMVRKQQNRGGASMVRLPGEKLGFEELVRLEYQPVGRLGVRCGQLRQQPSYRN